MGWRAVARCAWSAGVIVLWSSELMGVDDLVVAGSHGFDIWSPEGGAIEREEGAGFADLLGA